MAGLLANRIQTPDGTILQSFYVHDYKQHVDAVTGETYMVDGGLWYTRSYVNSIPAKEMHVTEEDPHEIVREAFHWGTRGKDGTEPLTWIALCCMETDHIKNVLVTQLQIPARVKQAFINELQYREDTNGV